MNVLNKGRVGIASLAVGIAQAGLEQALEYARQRKQFGREIAKFQGIQWLIAGHGKRYRGRSAAGAFGRDQNG